MEIKDLKKLFEERRARSIIRLKSFDEILSVYSDSAPEKLMTVNRDIRCPQRFEEAFPDRLHPRIKEWAENTDGSSGLYIYGGVGTGKTFNIYALAKLIRMNMIRVKVKNFPDWLDELRQSYDKFNAEQDIKDELRDEAILMIDDIGSEKQTEWVQEIIYRLINNRYEQIRPTIFSSNLSLSEIAGKYGERIASRIVEMVGGEEGIIKIDGEDRRLK